MKYHILGKSGLRVSEVCLGTMTFGTVWSKHFGGVNKKTAKLIFDNFVENGGNFIDTADIYQDGKSEKILGELLSKNRDNFVISSKYSTITNPNDPNSGGNHRKNLFSSVNASLKRLKTDFLDILWIHAWDFTTPVADVMRSLDDLVKHGKIHHIGISNCPSWIISQACALSESNGWTSFSAIQILYNLLERSAERELLPMAQKFGLGVLAWSPLMGGILSGKYSKNSQKFRFNRENPMTSSFLSEHNLILAKKISEIAKNNDLTSSQLALSWILHKKYTPIIPIIGANSLNQFKENMKSITVNLNNEIISSLDELSQIDLGYPHNFLNHDHIVERIFGANYVENFK